mgnify:CR=1 FL=1|tara:strand:+ start:820 stop:1218 length:399 start_codon:yes stop_codon:yes gene_type:complete
MSDVRTHLIKAKEEIRLGLIGALEEEYVELVPQLAAMYTDLTEKLKVVRAEFGGDDVVEFGGHLYNVPTQYNFNLESNVDLNTGLFKDDIINDNTVTFNDNTVTFIDPSLDGVDIKIDTSNHPDNVVTVGKD